MKSTIALLVATLAFAAVRLPAVAADGRDFAGDFSLTDVSESGGRVALTLSLHLFNYTGADLKQASVVVREPRFGRS